MCYIHFYISFRNYLDGNFQVESSHLVTSEKVADT